MMDEGDAKLPEGTGRVFDANALAAASRAGA